MRKFKLFSAAIFLVLFSQSAAADTFPSKPIKLVLGFGAGGGADVIARLYASELQKILNTPVIVENRAGAYEQIAGRTVQLSTPDGYTLWVATTGGVIQAPLMREMPYIPAKDFTAVGVIAEADAVLAIKNDLPIKSIDDLIAFARLNPGKLNYASAGTGAPSHLLVEYIQTVTNVKATHIPYKSAAEAAAALVAGNVDFAVVVPASSASLINAGKIRGLAVTAKERINVLPNVPTLEEGTISELKGLSVYAFYAVLGPQGMPPEVTRKLNDALNQVSKSQAVQKAAVSMSFRPVVSSPAEFSARIAKDTEIWGEVTKRIR